jgi:ubiquinone/menaquinone biosynthesis C-methylase UbiE/protein-S-isoprenylcysteine O-methyltransferase Ste14
MEWKWKFFYWPIVLLLVLVPGWIWHHPLSPSAAIFAQIIGVILFLWAIMLASLGGKTLKHFGHSAENNQFGPDKFIKKGIYAYMRHPMHLALAMLPLAISLIWGQLPSILAAGWGVAASFVFVLMVEEKEALERYGDTYVQYMKTVPAFSLSLRAIDRGVAALESPPPKEKRTQENSKVEVRGWEAKYYDSLMNIITFGWYPKFINNVIASLPLQPGAKVLDFGAGTGRNAQLMLKHIEPGGHIDAYEIGPEMIEQFQEKFNTHQNVMLHEHSILEEPLESEAYDLVFISFVFHGFTQEKREKIIANAYKALKPGGTFALLEYSSFDVSKSPLWIRFAIRKMECPLAEDFIERDLKEMLSYGGFDEESYSEKPYVKGYLRLATIKKR